ncbi:MAG: hypothetical protein GX066_09860 [Clostridiaceae bacterium]|nr:hypothetical protein [Clostridiaceae bacterium]
MYYYPYDAYVAQPQQPPLGFPWFPQPENRIIETGTTLKNRTGRLSIQFRKNFTRPPVVVISPYWRGQGSQVGYVETIESVSRNGFTVVSNNAADNYYINWIAIQEN